MNTSSTSGPQSADTNRGQILVLTALLMVLLIAITGLAIDVSGAYLTERWERSVADAAALAGGQSLQKPGTRLLPGGAEQAAAHDAAMHVLVSELKGTSTPTDLSCFAAAGCSMPGTEYWVSVQTPSPSCIDCQPIRSVQVSIWQPNFGLAFARVMNFTNWTVRSTSVAGMVVAPQYGIVTLRPSQLRPNLTDANYDDVNVTGGSKVVVGNADIATNSNATCSGASSGSEIVVDTASGFDIHHYGAGPYWTSPPGDCLNPPPGYQITSLVEDPAYPIPARNTSTPVYTTLAAALTDAATCLAEQAKIPSSYRELKSNLQINNPAAVDAICYKPGVYQKQLVISDPASGKPKVAVLLPGVYCFDAGVEVSSTLVGGYVADQPGIAAVFLEAKNSSGIPGQFVTKTNTSLVALNFGSKYCPLGGCAPGSWAHPAVDPVSGNPVQTSLPNPSLLTVMVVPDPTCQVVSPPSASCRENENQTLKLTGGGNIYLAGVQYAPSDNATLTGSSGQQSDVGAFWAWTLEFNGGTTFNLTSNKPQSAGVLRLDPACSPTLRNPPDCNR
jgi:hypothetical protein